MFTKPLMQKNFVICRKEIHVMLANDESVFVYMEQVTFPGKMLENVLSLLRGSKGKVIF